MTDVNAALEQFERSLYSETALRRRHRHARRSDLLDNFVFIRKIIAEIAFIASISMVVFALAFFLIFILGKV